MRHHNIVFKNQKLQHSLTTLIRARWLKYTLRIGVFFLVLIGIIFLLSNRADAGWWNDTWHYRKSFSITSGSAALTDFQVRIKDYNTSTDITAGKMQSDCGDIRFTSANGVELSYWIEDSTCNTSTTQIWVKIDSIPATGGTTIFMYYGNPSAANASNGNSVFEFFEDFNDSSIDTNKWPTASAGGSATCTETSGYYRDYRPASAGNSCSLRSADILSFSNNRIVEFRQQIVGSYDYYSTVYYRYDASNLSSICYSNYTNYESALYTGASSYAPRCGSSASTEGDIITDPPVNSWFREQFTVPDTSSKLNRYLNDTTSETSTTYNGLNSGGSVGFYSASTAAFVNETRTDWIIVRQYDSTGSTAGSPSSEEKGTSPIAYWSFDEGYGTTAHNQMENNGENGLVGWWKMDEGTGSTAYDEMGLNNGTITSASWSSSGRFGNALEFDGTDSDRVRTSISNYRSSDYMGTISLWLKPDDFGSDYYIFSSEDESSGNYLIGTMVEQTTGQVMMYQSNGASDVTIVKSSGSLTAGTWNHVVWLSTGTEYQIYINGQVQTLSVDAGSNNGDWFADTDFLDTIIIGLIYAGGMYIDRFDGLMDNIRVYNRVLSSDEIEADYNSLQAHLIYMDPASEWVDGAQANANQQPMGTALDFDGGDNNLSVQDNTSNNLDFGSTTDFSISAWVYREASDWLHTIIDKRDNASTGYLMGIHSDNAVHLYLEDSSNNSVEVSGSQTIVTETWNHIVGTFDRDGNATIYINGILDKQTSISSVSSSISNTNNLAIGYHSPGLSSSWGFFEGQIDEVKIFDYVLTANQVKVEYNRGFANNPDSGIPENKGVAPIGFWKLDEGSGETAFDSSGKDNLGKLTNMDAYTDWVAGKIGKALDFDGTNDYVNLTNHISDFEGLNAGTISLWFNTSNSGVSMLYSISDKDTATDTVYLALGNTTGSYADESFTFALQRTNTLRLTMFVRNGDGYYADGKWHQVTVATGDGDNRVVIDGVRQSVTFGAGSISTNEFSNIDNPDTIRVASRDTSGTDYYFTGQIDHLKIYNYARTFDQIHYDMGGSPVGYWKFDEGYGITAYDDMNHYDGSLTNGPTWVEGVQPNLNQKSLGRALDFNGSNQYISLTANALSGLTALTWSAWVKSESITGTRYIYLRTGVASSDQVYLQDKTNKFVCDLDSITGRQSKVSTNGLSDNSWHHVVCVYDSSEAQSDRVRIYVDGIEDTISPTSNTGSGSLGNDNESISYSSSAFNGKIDEFKIYNYALTADEVKVEYNRGSAAVLGTGLNDSDPGSSNLQAWWKMDEGTNTYIYDLSGNSNTGTLTGSTHVPFWSSGKIGKAVNFDGIDDYITIADSESFTLTSGYTIAAWLKPNSVISEDSRMIISQWGNTGSGNAAWALAITASGYLQVAHYNPTDGADTFEDTTTPVVMGQWQHVAAVYTGGITGTNCYLYVNGILVQSGNIASSPQNSSNYWVGIGRAYAMGSQVYYDGSIDNIKIYNSILIPAQIAWEYNQGKPVAYWRLDEKDGTTAYDESVSNNDGTLTNMDASTDHVSGKFNNALDFDGSNDYINISADSAIDLYQKNDFTISAWIYPRSDGEENMGMFYRKGISYLGVSNESGGSVAISCVVNLSGSNNASVTTSEKISLNQWSHIIAIWEDDSDDEVSIYINGKYSTASTNGDGSASNDTYSDLYIGGNAGDWTFDGKIDDLKFYNYALTADQIKVDFNKGAAVRY